MFKNLKIPAIATLVIMLLFIFQSYEIVRLNLKDEYQSDILGLMQYETNIKNSLKKDEPIAESLVYKYAIFDENQKKLVSNLEFLPSDLKFITKKQDGFIFYRSYFWLNEKAYYIVLAKQQNSARLIFVAVVVLSFCFIVIFATLYLSFIASIKPLMDAKKYMNTFFNDAMHELKTPLGVIGINLQMLGLENKYTARMSSALKQMQITYDDVEYYIKHSYIVFKPEILDISEICHQRARYMRGFAMSKNVKIFDFIEPNLQVFINKIELIRIIDNNLSNAVKYSNEGGVINLRLFLEDNFVILQVEDFGSGIKDVNKIWKRYTRDDGVRGGFGLGLNIVQSICIKNFISYSVSSTPKQGSIFCYKFKPYSVKILD
jgi:putative two-component sensor